MAKHVLFVFVAAVVTIVAHAISSSAKQLLRSHNESNPKVLSASLEASAASFQETADDNEDLKVNEEYCDGTHVYKNTGVWAGKFPGSVTSCQKACKELAHQRFSFWPKKGGCRCANPGDPMKSVGYAVLSGSVECVEASCTGKEWCKNNVTEPSKYDCSDSCVVKNPKKEDFGDCVCTDGKCPQMWECIRYRYDTATNPRAKQACDAVWAGKYGASPGLLDLAVTGVEVEMQQKCAEDDILDDHCCHELLRPCKEWNEKCFKEIAAIDGWFLGIYNESTINKTAQELGRVAPSMGRPPWALNATLPTVPSELTSTKESGNGDPANLDESLAGKRSC